MAISCLESPVLSSTPSVPALSARLLLFGPVGPVGQASTLTIASRHLFSWLESPVLDGEVDGGENELDEDELDEDTGLPVFIFRKSVVFWRGGALSPTPSSASCLKCAISPVPALSCLESPVLDGGGDSGGVLLRSRRLLPTGVVDLAMFSAACFAACFAAAASLRSFSRRFNTSIVLLNAFIIIFFKIALGCSPIILLSINLEKIRNILLS